MTRRLICCFGHAESTVIIWWQMRFSLSCRFVCSAYECMTVRMQCQHIAHKTHLCCISWPHCHGTHVNCRFSGQKQQQHDCIIRITCFHVDHHIESSSVPRMHSRIHVTKSRKSSERKAVERFKRCVERTSSEETKRKRQQKPFAFLSAFTKKSCLFCLQCEWPTLTQVPVPCLCRCWSRRAMSCFAGKRAA